MIDTTFDFAVMQKSSSRFRITEKNCWQNAREMQAIKWKKKKKTSTTSCESEIGNEFFLYDIGKSYNIEIESIMFGRIN